MNTLRQADRDGRVAAPPGKRFLAGLTVGCLLASLTAVPCPGAASYDPLKDPNRMEPVMLMSGNGSVTIQVSAQNRKALNDAIQGGNNRVLAMAEDRSLPTADRRARIKAIRAATSAQIQNLLTLEEYRKYVRYDEQVRSMEEEQQRAIDTLTSPQSARPAQPWVRPSQPAQASHRQQTPSRTATSRAAAATPTAESNAVPSVQGVFYQGGEAAVLINGQVLTVGSWFGKSRIVSITMTNVVLQQEGNPPVMLSTHSR